jgi:hypothetical protein
MAFADLQNKITEFTAIDFGTELFNVVDANTILLSDMQREQMATGLDANDKPVLATQGAFYTPYTMHIKEAVGVGLGAEINVVTNYMTGAFYDSLQKKVYPDGTVESNSNVDYFEDILNRSGEVAVDLNKEYRREFAETKVVPHITQLINGIFSK